MTRLVKKKKLTLSQKAYEYIKEQIVLGKIKGGEIITEQSIGDALNMSRTPVKRALTQLEAENYVKCVDGIGNIVVELSIKDLADVYDVRTSIEVLALKGAINRISDEEIDKMKTKLLLILKNYEDNFNITADYISKVDSQVHNLIIDNCSNNYVKTLMSYIETRIDRYKYEAYNITDTGEESAKQHLKLLDDIKTRDLDKSIKTLVDHIKWSYRAISDAFTDLNY